VDGSGDITQDEFKKALKMISLGLSDNEIEKII
jgi:Ca2+-binding EF-hand superfamily protein